MKLIFKKKQAALEPKPVSEMLRAAILKTNLHVPDLEARLRVFPQLEKGINLGDKRPQTPFDNALEYANDTGNSLYIGYLIYPDREGNWSVNVHSWCVSSENKVIEPTRGINWSPYVHYVGVKVPDHLKSKKTYLVRFAQNQCKDTWMWR